MHWTVATAIMAVLMAIALFALILRFYTRMYIEKRRPIIADYIIVLGWLSGLGWIICHTLALRLLDKRPLLDDGGTDSVEYLKIVYVSIFFFDFGLMIPKLSMTMFYWWLIPESSTVARRVLWVCTIYVICTVLTTFFSDLLFCLPIRDNWNLDTQDKSVWYSYTNTSLNWYLNISTDAILFLMPIAIFRSPSLRKSQRLSLVAVFSLGLVTIGISACRFWIADAESASFGTTGALWCTGEIVVGIIVVTVPIWGSVIVHHLKGLGVTCRRMTGRSTTSQKSSAYMRDDGVIRLSGPSSGGVSGSHASSRYPIMNSGNLKVSMQTSDDDNFDSLPDFKFLTTSNLVAPVDDDGGGGGAADGAHDVIERHGLFSRYCHRISQAFTITGNGGNLTSTNASSRWP